jgi:amidohydrolase
MIGDGLFERFACDAVFGMHNRPGLAVGKFAIRGGPAMAGAAFFDIAIRGRGAHGARPESGIDPIIAASHLATALQTIVSRNLRPSEAAVVSVTRFHAGEAYNVIPEKAVIGGTVRAFAGDAFKLIEERMQRLAEGVAGGFGADAETEFRLLFPPLVNDASETRFIADTAAELVGAANVNRDSPPVMASEDFSQMLECRPGAYIWIGNGDSPESCQVHHPGYDFNDAALPYGASLFARLAERKLSPAAR